MTVILRIPRIWELIRGFKLECQLKGWETSEHEDWVKVGNEYHNFLWIRSIQPSTFKKVVIDHKCVIKEGVSYHVVDVSYTSWLFPEPPLEKVIQMVAQDPKLSRKTAIYDLSPAYEGKLACLRLNETDSIVFREFEKFLEKRWGVELRSAF